MRKINTFLSSSMTGELAAERAVIRSLFRENTTLKEFYELYAIEEHASPNAIEQAYVDQVKASEVMILIAGQELREAVEKEFDTARDNRTKVFCYIKNNPTKRSPALTEFIHNKAYMIHCGHFSDSLELAEKVRSDLLEDLVTPYVREIRAKVSGKSYATFIASTPSSEYWFFPVDEILKVSQLESVSELDTDQLITMSLVLSEDQGSYKEALLLLEVALMKNPDNWMVYNNRGTLLDIMGLREAAMYSYKKANKVNPNSDTVYYNLGNSLYDLGKYREALDCYKKSIDLKPDKKTALNRISACFIALGEYSQALEWTLKAVQDHPDDIILANLGLCYSLNGQHEKALEGAETIKHNLYLYHKVRTFALFEKKDYSNAISEIDILFNKGKLDYELGIKKFYCLTKLNKREEAIKWIAYMEDNFPINASDYNNIAYTLMTEFGLHELARGLFEKAISQEPKLMQAWNNLQVSYSESALYDQGLKACDQALAIDGYDPKSIKNKLAFLYRQGRLIDALRFTLDRVFRLFGSFDSENEINEQLNTLLEKPEMKNLQKYEEILKLLMGHQGRTNK